MSTPDSVDVERVLSSLKGFQRRSVDYVFERLYGPEATRRFLLADEVGLGKTHVARGVIAKAIEQLRTDGVKRIDIVYICSNADIARQNISRLNVTGQPDFQLATRITLLPQIVRELAAKSLNFISFTPGTSFSLGNNPGKAEERLLLYWLLKWTWPSLCDGTGALNVLQGLMSRDRFRAWVREYDPHQRIDRGLAKQFSDQLGKEDQTVRELGELTYEARFCDLCKRFGRSRKHIPRADKHDRNAFIGEMRTLLAATCIEALEPDLIILDEFQRFKDLLRPDNPAGALARHLFAWGEARVLLMSATPYKMYTLSHESDIDDHYRDFVDTLRFLFNDDARTDRIKRLLGEYSRASARVDRAGVEPLRRVKQLVESELRRVMCRTEKLAVTEDRSGMLRDAAGAQLTLRPEHVQSYLSIRRITDALGHRDIVEYWKSSPFLLNFMDSDHYKLKLLLRDASDTEDGPLHATLSSSAVSLLDRDAWQSYDQIDPQHAQLEYLLDQTLGANWWRLLWMPPSCPYYGLSGVFAAPDVDHMTKRLVFSSWHFVPRAISILLSYEAERQMMTVLDDGATNTSESRERRRPLLTFSRSDGRLTGMPVLAMLYPSFSLAELGVVAASASAARGEGLLNLDSVLKRKADEIGAALEPVVENAPSDGAEDESWYWAAPILLDRQNDRAAVESWFDNIAELADAWSGEKEEAKGWREHVVQAREVAFGEWHPRGKPPADLANVLALLAVGGPANCALRAIAHLFQDAELFSDVVTRRAAGRVAWGFRTLFNTLEVISLLRGLSPVEPYWRRALEYCADGCLQSVLDEYLHMLLESEGLVDRPTPEAAMAIAEVVASTVGMRAATPGLDWVRAEESGRVLIENQRVRARFAMRFGDERGEHDESAVRKEAVRKAFNSPFWPFVLATTSIGQEGLDFHTYCHAVVHWNLPCNPVDLEQREGRVHRYKGHAVRKNVARVARDGGDQAAISGNPWRELFERASRQMESDSGISPYWVFPVVGGAVIERHVLSLPLSREAARLPALRRSLAVYRMVFGQPRQEDLVEHLKRLVPEDEWGQLSRELAIDLEPVSTAG